MNEGEGGSRRPRSGAADGRVPTTWGPFKLKRAILGAPYPTQRLEHERLGKATALAVLSSDAISSVAYATEQILIVLAVLGTVALRYVVPISVVIVALLVLVGLSYRQTVFAYPSGGGSYTVAKANLGTGAGLLAAAALLTDYVLTVAVSVSSGIAALTSAYPSLLPWRVSLCVAAIAGLMLMNLRGVRESGTVFSIPTYAFIGMMLALLASGVWQAATAHVAVPVPVAVRVDPVSAAMAGVGPVTGFALVYLLMRAFAEGCSAMTGTEAISNGVTAFRPPAARNAATTIGWMVTLLAVFFLGTGWLAHHFAVQPSTTETVLSQLGHHLLGGGLPYYLLQASTFLILVLAANTAFAGFPMLGSILAQDRFLPRQLAARGDRLAFSNGIVMLAGVAAVLVVAFRGDAHALIPLYAVGVFVCFTLSQAGMVQHWRRCREPGWRWRMTLNGVGAVATALVVLVQVGTKFTEGAWIVVLVIPLFILTLRGIHRHYERFAKEILYTGQAPLLFLHHTVLVPVSDITKATAGALVYATTISEDVRAVYVETDAEATETLQRRWEEWDIGVPLVVLPSPFRSVLRPLVEYVDGLEARHEADVVSIVVPEIVPRRWWEHLLHNKTALYIKTLFLFRPNVIITAVPFHLGVRTRWEEIRDGTAGPA